MIFHGNYTKEVIVVHPHYDESDHQFVELIKDADEPMFTVSFYAGDELYCWDFEMNNNSDYDRVKFNVMEAIFDVEDMEELAEVLDKVFNDGFEDILITECCGDCKHCPYDEK